MAFQQQVQIKLNKQEQIDAQLLKEQLDSLFDIFRSVVVLKQLGDKVDQDTMISRNDLGVSTLKLFGSTCQNHKDKKEGKTLRAAYAHFHRERSQFTANPDEAQILLPWMQYVECALVSKAPLPKLRISKQTVETAEKNMVSGMPSFLNRFMGANHQTTDKVKEVESDPVKYAEQHHADVQGTMRQYNAQQKTAQWPSQNDMYLVSGGGHNIEFSDGVYEKPKSAFDDGKASGDDSDEVMGGMGSMSLSSKPKASGPKASGSQPPMNALIKKKPPQTLRSNNQKVTPKYPFGCRVEKVLDAHSVGVVFANPYGACKAQIAVSNIETSAEKVGRWERKHIQKNGGKGLGYPSIDDLNRKKKGGSIYQ